MTDKFWPEKLRESLDKSVNPDITDKIITEIPKLKDMTESTRWVKETITRLDQFISDESLKRDIISRCCCVDEISDFSEIKEAFQKNRNLDELLERLYKNPFYNRPERQGNTIYITKVPCRPEEYAKAETPEEKRLYYCHCDMVRATQEPISKTYCYCGAGWCGRIFESILDRPVEIEIIKSVISGDDECVIAVHL